MNAGMTNKPADCLDCGVALVVPRNPRTVRCPTCREERRIQIARKAKREWYQRKKESDPEYIQKEYDRHNAYRRRKYAEDEEWAAKRLAESRRSRAKAFADPQKRKERRKYQTEWRRKNRERINAQNRARFRQLRLDALAAYGGQCACCREDREPFLCIDHKHGGGNKHRRQINPNYPNSGGGWRTYQWLKDHDYPSGFRVLCHNCNLAIGFYGQCPHQTAE